MSPSQSLGLCRLLNPEAGCASAASVFALLYPCESLAELSWLVWDAEDSLEFYPAQVSQSFFSLPRSLRPRNRLERSGVGP
ncbi:hypothetical protein Taro_024453 [Colocasia esculenta]|uniref:Uncharacterized protein n=1 Tax=Colocasia esculenta TaxID=4460 RepID=A0A843VBD0_COLES|nr:hypothetical protein [Colocasia esculenta]